MQALLSLKMTMWPGRLAQQGRLGLRVGRLAQQGRQALRADQQGQQGRQGPQVTRDPQALREPEGCKAYKDQLDLWDRKDQQVRPAPQDPPEGLPDRPETPDQQGPRVPQVHKA